MTIPYTFAGATTAIPLAQLDANFASPITLGNVAMTLSNTYTSIGNLTLTNVTVSSGNVAVTNLSYTGTLTGGTGIVNLGSGQFYKDASGNVGIGTTSPTLNLSVGIASGTGGINHIYTGAGGPYSVANFTSNLNTGEVQIGGVRTNYFPTFYSSGSEAMRIDSSGNVGIGTSSPISNASRKTLSIFTSDASVGGQIVVGYNSSSEAVQILGDSTGAYFGSKSNIPVIFRVNQTETARFDTSGNLLVGTTTSLASGLTVTGGNGPQFSLNTTTRFTQFNFYNSGTQKSFIAWDNTNTNLYVQNSSGGVYLTNTGTSWTSNSDERLKENLVDITDGLSKVCSLRSVIGNFIADKTKKKTPFLIAQDVQTVLPEAVTTSTLKDDETNTEYLGIAYTEVIPLLVASIKELNAKVDAQATLITNLTTRLTALEGK